MKLKTTTAGIALSVSVFRVISNQKLCLAIFIFLDKQLSRKNSELKPVKSFLLGICCVPTHITGWFMVIIMGISKTM